MYIFVYCPDNSKIARGVIEEKIDELLEGKGEVTGGGTGNQGSNIDIDIEIYEGDSDAHREKLLKMLKDFDFPDGAYMQVDGRKIPLKG